MARKINPFAVCKAAGKRGRWSKKKIERCIRAVKKSTGMGHITETENEKVGFALTEAKATCFRRQNKNVVRACLDGVDFSEKALVRRGFKP
jgi:hypothetical protein